MLAVDMNIVTLVKFLVSELEYTVDDIIQVLEKPHKWTLEQRHSVEWAKIKDHSPSEYKYSIQWDNGDTAGWMNKSEVMDYFCDDNPFTITFEKV